MSFITQPVNPIANGWKRTITRARRLHLSGTLKAKRPFYVHISPTDIWVSAIKFE